MPDPGDTCIVSRQQAAVPAETGCILQHSSAACSEHTEVQQAVQRSCKKFAYKSHQGMPDQHPGAVF
jgi:hypothetical protein